MPTISSSLGMQDFFTTTLSAAVSDASDLTIYLNSVPTQTEGYLVIDYSNSTKREIIFYNAVGANYVTCPADGRGQGGTTAQAHDLGADVRMNMVSGYFDGITSGLAIDSSAIKTAHIADAQITNAKLSTTAGETGGAWKAWTPTWANLTIGNATQDCKYTQIGKTIHFRCVITLGNTSSVGTNPTFTLPVASNAAYLFTPCGSSRCQDTSGAWYLGTVYANGSTGQPIIYNTSGSWIASAGLSATNPFTWTNTDVMYLTGTYEAA